MFRFAHPEYLNALFIIPLFVLIFGYFLYRRKKLLNNFADKNLQKVLIPSLSISKRVTKFIIFLSAFALLIVAAANPQIGTRMEEVKQTGIDVFILLDVSLSMKAEDIKPNRLEKAKYQIANLIRKLQGDRIGMIIFAGEAFVQFPLTTDYSAANLFLDAVDFNSIPTQGTAIASAIELASKSFDYKTSTQKAIVLITDGEDHEGDIDKAVEEAVSKNILIYTIGLGSPEGVPIPITNKNGEQVDFKKDNEGNPVLTKLDENTLKEIASSGKGKYYRGTNYDDHLQMIYDDLAKLEKSEFGIKKVTDYEDRYYYFLAPGLLLLILEFFLTERRSKLFSRLNRKFGID